MTQKIWITKYALTQGITEVEAEVEEGHMYRRATVGTSFPARYYNKDFQLTREDAVNDAERRREAKIKSLKKALEKVQNLKF